MSQNHLEEFFKQNKEAFDDSTPSLKVWADIDNQLDYQFKQRSSLWKYMRIAAAILVLVTAGGVLTTFMQGGEKAEIVLSPEIAEMESFYQQQFQKKYSQLVSLPHDAAIDEDLGQIDVFMEEIKKELENAPKGSEERILQSLIKNYKLKIQLLDRVLDKIQHESLEEKIVKNEGVSI